MDANALRHHFGPRPAPSLARLLRISRQAAYKYIELLDRDREALSDKAALERRKVESLIEVATKGALLAHRDDPAEASA